jgi:hypothetical protein
MLGKLWNYECVVKLDEFCLARSCYLSKAKRERDSLAEEKKGEKKEKKQDFEEDN